MPRKVKAVFKNQELDTNMAKRNVFEKKHKCELFTLKDEAENLQNSI